jgi:hypothetical protein
MEMEWGLRKRLRERKKGGIRRGRGIGRGRGRGSGTKLFRLVTIYKKLAHLLVTWHFAKSKETGTFQLISYAEKIPSY